MRTKSPRTYRAKASDREVPDANGQRWLTVRGARHNNLKNIDVHFPLGRFICVTGVSGSGKSSLVIDVVRERLARDLNGAEEVSPGDCDGIDGLEHLDKVIDIDQQPIGRTPRSNPATYIKVFDEIRDLYAKLPDSKVRGYKPGRFSFNVPSGEEGGGRCEACEGNGANRLDMEFLADIWVPCPVCDGRRFNRETLAIHFRGKSIADVLDMDVQEALQHFANIPKIAGMLQTLHDVGLDYIKLGQSSTTLSGGEAQRIKLGRELVRRSTGRTLYILDEPTTGLHFEDIRRLLDVLHGFVDSGNTVVVIEHNLDVIKTADWVIDLGPEGGEAGGYIVAAGTPERVADCEASYTGQALRPVLRLGGHPPPPP
ncbi:MAG: ATP-binding cassette domain-containing protein, partial [Phycisphaerae bacterium]|nr:ATP-binding cassette domain-containing protein [Phycisphaerae bacterium]